MQILSPIKPEYSDKIFSGEKRFEFRRQRPWRSIEVVYVYASHPTRKIVGWFRVGRIISGTPADIRTQCSDAGGIGEEDYFEYCGNKNVVYAFQIEMALHFDEPIDPSELRPDVSHPQSFSYITESMRSVLKLDEDDVESDVDKLT